MLQELKGISFPVFGFLDVACWFCNGPGSSSVWQKQLRHSHLHRHDITAGLNTIAVAIAWAIAMPAFASSFPTSPQSRTIKGLA